MVYTVNNSIDDNYHSQINNTLVPLASCNTTSAIMYLKNNQIPFDYPKEKQPEDYLTELLITDEAIALKNKWFPQKWAENYRPQEIHYCLSWGINKLCETKNKIKVSEISETRKLIEIIYDLRRGKSLIMSGSFTPSGHVVCVVGFESLQDPKEINCPADVNLSVIRNIIIDDPYGDYNTNYKNHKGNNVRIEFSLFNSLTRVRDNIDRKLCHYPIV